MLGDRFVILEALTGFLFWLAGLGYRTLPSLFCPPVAGFRQERATHSTKSVSLRIFMMTFPANQKLPPQKRDFALSWRGRVACRLEPPELLQVGQSKAKNWPAKKAAFTEITVRYLLRNG